MEVRAWKKYEKEPNMKIEKYKIQEQKRIEIEG